MCTYCRTALEMPSRLFFLGDKALQIWALVVFSFLFANSDCVFVLNESVIQKFNDSTKFSIYSSTLITSGLQSKFHCIKFYMHVKRFFECSFERSDRVNI